MKSIGIVRNVDDLGRVVIPKELRNTMSINEKDPMEIYVDGDSIIFRKYNPGCVFCDSVENNVEYKGKTLCKECINELENAKNE